QDVADAFAKGGQEIDKKFISLPGRTIKRLGSYEATVRLHREVVIQVPFEIVSEKG
ncbi:50S ribosomal protein L9, partial [Flavobacteriaceae bacterium]|nr:50S ribosomal protein L9 [Flavobacteriaceae bacterium]